MYHHPPQGYANQAPQGRAMEPMAVGAISGQTFLAPQGQVPSSASTGYPTAYIQAQKAVHDGYQRNVGAPQATYAPTSNNAYPDHQQEFELLKARQEWLRQVVGNLHTEVEALKNRVGAAPKEIPEEAPKEMKEDPIQSTDTQASKTSGFRLLSFWQ